LRYDRRLIDEGAALNIPDINLCTALHRARDVHDPVLVQLLLEAKSDPNVSHPGLDGWTPLHLAAWRNDICSCRLLLTKGAVPRALDWDGRAPGSWCKGEVAFSDMLEKAAAQAGKAVEGGGVVDAYAGVRGNTAQKISVEHLERIERSMREAEEYDRRQSKL